jgi:hypothetical protein
MTRFDNATQEAVEAANVAMAEIAAAPMLHEERIVRIHEIWEPVANALTDSIPEGFEQDWPDDASAADAAGTDFVGVTSDTRRPVFWGADFQHYRPFIIR